MPHLDPDSLPGEPLSYSRRRRPETPREVVWNRISITGSLFVTAVLSAFLLGRRRY